MWAAQVFVDGGHPSVFFSLSSVSADKFMQCHEHHHSRVVRLEHLDISKEISVTTVCGTRVHVIVVRVFNVVNEVVLCLLKPTLHRRNMLVSSCQVTRGDILR